MKFEHSYVYSLRYTGMGYTEELKERVDHLLEKRGLKAADLIAHMGIGVSTYYDMWKNGYITVDRLRSMAMSMERLYVLKTHAVPRHQMGELVKRCNQVLDELTHYGAEVPRAHSVHRMAKAYPF